MIYAGFWRRCGAFIVDDVILHILSGLLLSLFGLTLIEGADASSFNPDIVLNKVVETFLFEAIASWVILSWFYHAWFQSSKYQATPGMMLLKMRLVGYDGKRVSFGRTSWRFLVSIFSFSFFFLGYLMIIVMPRKQAFHDYIAKTLVVLNSSQKR